MLGWSRQVVQLTWRTQEQQTRGMATLKAISLRLKSVKNIRKITQTMKMVSAAKYARAERELRPARPYGIGATTFYEKAEVQPVEEKPNKLIIAMTSDKGLCGAVHSSICKRIRAELAEGSSNAAIVCVGDKSKGILMRQFAPNILFQVNEVGRKSATFEDAAAIASGIINSGYDFGSGKLVFNKFKSVVSYNTMEIPIFSLESINNAPKIGVYDSLDADILQSYMEYSLASIIFYALKEGACSEQSARMSAMESASKNAGEVIDKLTITFNRTRQAVITGELIEIISGAAAL